MTRRPATFSCDGARLFGTLDEAPGTTGLLLVSGGNEVRAGAWAGQSLLAAAIASAGHPVLRFDRRGIGDSEGANRGFRSSEADLAASLAALRAEAPRLTRIVGFGNCDAGSALALFGAGIGLDALVLANPWVVDGDDDEPPLPASALSGRYRDKLLDPSEWRRLLRGKIDLVAAWRDIRRARGSGSSRLAEQMREGLDRFAGPVTILLAERDRTAQLFDAAWPAGDPRVRRTASASHSFSDDAAREWLLARVLEALASA